MTTVSSWTGVIAKSRLARPAAIPNATVDWAIPRSSDEIVVDARGHRCPVPTLRLHQAVERAPGGARVRLLADDPLARIDAPHFAREAGLEVLEARWTDDGLTFLVRKGS
ncbi:MAG: sulfurtransferase TusA family protein [Caulobacteraceae bacterium]|nr:sulfurtransferase TusA family protein [Caulobacteraceae bacterium]